MKNFWSPISAENDADFFDKQQEKFLAMCEEAGIKPTSEIFHFAFEYCSGLERDGRDRAKYRHDTFWTHARDLARVRLLRHAGEADTLDAAALAVGFKDGTFQRLKKGSHKRLWRELKDPDYALRIIDLVDFMFDYNKKRPFDPNAGEPT